MLVLCLIVDSVSSLYLGTLVLLEGSFVGSTNLSPLLHSHELYTMQAHRIYQLPSDFIYMVLVTALLASLSDCLALTMRAPLASPGTLLSFTPQSSPSMSHHLPISLPPLTPPRPLTSRPRRRNPCYWKIGLPDMPQSIVTPPYHPPS